MIRAWKLPSPTWPTIVDRRPESFKSCLVSYTNCGSLETGTLPADVSPFYEMWTIMFLPDISSPHPRAFTPTSYGAHQRILTVLPEFSSFLVGGRKLELLAPVFLDDRLYCGGGLFDRRWRTLQLEEKGIAHWVRLRNQASIVDGVHH